MKEEEIKLVIKAVDIIYKYKHFTAFVELYTKYYGVESTAIRRILTKIHKKEYKRVQQKSYKKLYHLIFEADVSH